MPHKFHEYFSNVNFADKGTLNPTSLRRFVNSKKFTPSIYRDLLSGKYHDNFTPEAVDELHSYLQSSSLNRPANNDKVVDAALDKGEGESVNCDVIKRILRYFQLSPQKIDGMISLDKSLSSSMLKDLLSQSNLSENHLENIAKSNDYAVDNDTLNHPKMTKPLLDKIISHNNADLSKLPLSVIYHKLIDGENATSLLEKNDDLASKDVDLLLSKLEDSKRNKFLDDKLGISDGSSIESPEKDTPGWNSWQNGSDYSPGLSIELASSCHLLPHQIEHIKRHGNDQQKYGLLSNDNVSDQNIAEMLGLWSQNRTDKGYSYEALKAVVQKENENNAWDRYWDESVKELLEENPISKHISDNYDDDSLSKAYFGKSKDDWTKDHMHSALSSKIPLENASVWSDIKDSLLYSGAKKNAEEVWKSQISSSPMPKSISNEHLKSLEDALYERITQKFESDLNDPNSIGKLLPKRNAPESGDQLNKKEMDQKQRNKLALTLKTLKDNSELLEQIRQANPEAHNALMQLSQSLVELFQHKTGEDPKTLIDQLEIQQALEEQQAQQQAQLDPNQAPGDSSQEQPLHGKQLVNSTSAGQ